MVTRTRRKQKQKNKIQKKEQKHNKETTPTQKQPLHHQNGPSLSATKGANSVRSAKTFEDKRPSAQIHYPPRTVHSRPLPRPYAQNRTPGRTSIKHRRERVLGPPISMNATRSMITRTYQKLSSSPEVGGAYRPLTAYIATATSTSTAAACNRHDCKPLSYMCSIENCTAAIQPTATLNHGYSRTATSTAT